MSEGLDFTDANARAVVILGIPFPNTKDKQVRDAPSWTPLGGMARLYPVPDSKNTVMNWNEGAAPPPLSSRVRRTKVGGARGRLQVQAKKVYNTQGRRRGLLSGDVWFEQQAFRCGPVCSSDPVASRLRIDSGFRFIFSCTTPCAVPGCLLGHSLISPGYVPYWSWLQLPAPASQHTRFHTIVLKIRHAPQIFVGVCHSCQSGNRPLHTNFCPST